MSLDHDDLETLTNFVDALNDLSFTMRVRVSGDLCWIGKENEDRRPLIAKLNWDEQHGYSLDVVS